MDQLPTDILDYICTFLPNKDYGSTQQVFNTHSYNTVTEMRYLLRKYNTLRKAIDANNLDVVKWYYQYQCYFIDDNDAWLTNVGNGDMYYIIYHIIDYVSSIGHLNIVKFLHQYQNGFCGCSTQTMDLAAINGHLDVVKWLHLNRTEGCTVNAMDYAAKYGHLDVVKWLHLNRTEGCTVNAMDYAAKSGHLDVVKWLHLNRTEGCTVDAMNYAAYRGHLDVIKWLHLHRKEGCTVDAMDGAAANGHLNAVKWLHLNRKEGCTTKAIDNAALFANYSNNVDKYLDIIIWLLDNTMASYTNAAYSGHPKIAEYLRSREYIDRNYCPY